MIDFIENRGETESEKRAYRVAHSAPRNDMRFPKARAFEKVAATHTSAPAFGKPLEGRENIEKIDVQHFENIEKSYPRDKRGKIIMKVVEIVYNARKNHI